METIIETKQLAKAISAHTIIPSLNLTVPTGSIYGFLGPNGAGKTTTIRLLLGLMRPTAGQIRIFGLPFDQHRHRILSQIGSLVEGPSLYSHLTGRQNLQIAAKIRDIPTSRIDEVLSIVSLQPAADMPTEQYSLGMKQRLGLAIAILHQPTLLILDEPTNGLDPEGIKDIRETIQSFRRDHGMTILLSSHLLSEIELIATHIGVINRGTLLFQGSLHDLQARQQPEVVFGVDNERQAAAVLTALKLNATQAGPQQFKIAVSHRHEIASINQSLVKAGVGVHSVKTVTKDLEDIFMQLTHQGE